MYHLVSKHDHAPCYAREYRSSSVITSPLAATRLVRACPSYMIEYLIPGNTLEFAIFGLCITHIEDRVHHSRACIFYTLQANHTHSLPSTPHYRSHALPGNSCGLAPAPASYTCAELASIGLFQLPNSCLCRVSAI